MALLGDLVEITGGGTPSRKNADYWGGEIYWATVKDFKSLTLSGALEKITSEGLENSASNYIPAGSIIIPTRMAVGKAAINTVGMAINQDLKALHIKDNENVDRDYLFRALLSKSTYLESRGKGATVKGITLDVLRELEIPLPPLKEQKRIASILDKADAIRRNRQQAIDLTNQLLRSVFLDMFGDPVMNPKEWNEVALGDVINIVGGGTPSRKIKEYWGSDIPWASVKDFSGTEIKNTIESITREGLDNSASNLIRAGSIVVPTRMAVGKAAINAIDIAINQDLKALTIKDSSYIDMEYLFRYLLGRSACLIKRSKGATVKGITLDVLKELRVPVPPYKLQLSFNKIATKLSMELKRMEGSRKNMDHLFQSLSKQVFQDQLTNKTKVA